MQLRYGLARVFEDRNDIAAASRIIDTIYHDNPLILGVVPDYALRLAQYASTTTRIEQARQQCVNQPQNCHLEPDSDLR